MPKPSGYKPLPGSERPQVAGSTLVGPVEASESIAFTLLLRRRPGSPELNSFEHWQNTAPGKRRFLSVEEYTQTYGSGADDLEAVLDYLKSRGLRVIEADAGRQRIVAEGTAAKINSAFEITLNHYRAPHRFVPRPAPKKHGHESKHTEITEHLHRGFEGPVHLPAALVEVVRAIIGLDNRRLGGPAGTGTGDPVGANSLLPTACAQLYNFPTSGAAGQTIGLFAAADEGSAYLPSDITLFITNLPAGFNTSPNVTPIGLTVGATTYSNNTSLITGGSPSGAAQETTQDIETSARPELNQVRQ